MSKTFAEILSRPVNSIEKPQPRPLGTYYANAIGLPKQKESGDHKILEYWFKLSSPKELNDPSANTNEIASWGPLSKGIFLDNEEQEYAHRQFLINTFGIDPGPDASPKSVGEMVSEVPGRQALVTLKHRPYVDASGAPGIATDIATVARA